MEKISESAEVDIVRRFVDKRTSLQQQFYRRYHGDHFLSDGLVTPLHVPAIQKSVRGRMPATSYHAINQVTSKLSDQPITAGTITVAHLTQEEKHTNQPTKSMYTLGQRYSEGQRRDVKTNVPKMFTSVRKLSGSWLRGVKGWFCMRKDHSSNEIHKKDEI